MEVKKYLSVEEKGHPTGHFPFHEYSSEPRARGVFRVPGFHRNEILMLEGFSIGLHVR